MALRLFFTFTFSLILACSYSQKIKVQGNTRHGKEEGLWIYKDSTGNITDSIWFTASIKDSFVLRRYDSNQLVRRLYQRDVFKTRNDILYRKDGSIYKMVIYKDTAGLMYTYKRGGVIIDTLTGLPETPAEFPGGKSEWQKYLHSKLDEFFSLSQFNFGNTRCQIEFVITEAGKLIVKKIYTSGNAAFYKAVFKALAESPIWKPATLYGKPIIAYKTERANLMAD